MATQPTTNVVPSESPRDLKFNAGKIDEFVTSLSRKYQDRFGNDHYTIEGIRWLAQQAIAQYGYITVDSFQAGAAISLPNQVLRDTSTGEYYRWDGQLPKTVAAGSTPAAAGGVGPGKWLSVGAAAVASNLASSQDGFGDSLIAVKQPLVGAVARTQHQKNTDAATYEDFGAIGDGTLHPLSELFGSLASAQSVYPFVTSLNQSVDYAAIQSAYNSGCQHLTNSGFVKRYVINETLVMNQDRKVRLSSHSAELIMDHVDGNKPHIKVGYQSSQVVGQEISGFVLINKQASTVPVIDAKNVGLLKVLENRFYGNDLSYQHIRINTGVICEVARNYLQNAKDKSIILVGTGINEKRCIDITIYDNRVEHCKNAIEVGDFVEGVFIRRNILYRQNETCISIVASSLANSLLSIKIQDNDIDGYGYSGTGYGIYMQNFRAAQIQGNWFASDSSDPAINTLPSTGDVMINTNIITCKNATAISCNSDGAIINVNMINGAVTGIYIGSQALNFSLSSNNIRGTSSQCISVDSSNRGSIGTNYLFRSSGSTISNVNSSQLTIDSNSGDTGRGTLNNITLGASPATYTSKNRPETISIKGGSVSKIAIGAFEVAVSTNQTLSVPPNTPVVITYSGSAPGVTAMAL